MFMLKKNYPKSNLFKNSSYPCLETSTQERLLRQEEKKTEKFVDNVG